MLSERSRDAEDVRGQGALDEQPAQHALQQTRSLAEQYRFDREAYTEAKGPFLRAVLAVALPI